MIRWIDADALHEALKTKQKWVVRCDDKHNEGYTYDQVHFAIDDAPSIDIIRCGECKYWKSTVQMPNGTEVKCLYGRKADDFCSYGEREGE